MMKRLVFFLSLYSIFLNGAFLSHAQGATVYTGSSQYTPPPRIIGPIKETLDITGKGGILFKWGSRRKPSSGRRGFRFQLYRGYEMYEQDLIFKKELDPYTFEIFIEKGFFKNGMVYTWSIRQRSRSSIWSKRNFYSFKVIKEDGEENTEEPEEYK